MFAYITPILLLLASNVFMTFAWYGHLRFTDRPLWLVIVVSWGIAFFEYCLQVPGNRIGFRVYNPAQLKTIQEIVTLSVFVVFYDLSRRHHQVEPPRWLRPDRRGGVFHFSGLETPFGSVGEKSPRPRPSPRAAGADGI